ncbi:hypothetical protein ASN18_1048 [Candidatus Magnetominusculus xianensis]|uniref:Uncharacterized protein n=1 Tax=Candidatus Magnetominusculus xianensis TaxID=1748249 RepID=A0ABR5SH00_9BACT|nr:hypothetical protein ASN18_1048 [Candidatus Magnetominusculus xianensis]MBF0403119.1 hypothetical protein [Nitrospirota bacterium]
MKLCDDCNSILVLAREYFTGNMYSCVNCKNRFFFPVVWFFAEEGVSRKRPVMVCREL